MATFRFELPDGRSVSMEAPDADSAYRAFRQAVSGTAERHGPDVESGDEARAMAAGNTRAKMRPQDIEYAYDTAAARGDRPESNAMARAFVQRERADSPVMSRLSDIGRSVARGVPVLGGMADEANAATSALLGGDYQKRLDYERAKDATYDEENPKSAFAGQLAGGVLSGVGIAARVAPALSAMARPVALGTGLAGGGTLGAADGFTRGEEGFDDRLKSAAFGGVLGAGLGAAAPVIGKALSAGAKKTVDAVLRSGALKRIGLTPASESVLTRAMQADGSLGGQGARNIAAAGPDAMVVDAGPNALQLLDTAVQRGGPGVNRARTAIDGRVARAGQEVTDALDVGLGRPQGVASTTEGLRTGSAAARGSAYDRAYAAPIDYAAPEAQALQDLLQRVPESAIARANALMKAEGVKSRQIMATIADDGTVTFKTLPDVRQLDYITRGLNEVAKSAEGQGALGGTTDYGRVIGNLSRDIRDKVKTLVPEYGSALDTAAQPIRAREAMEFGAEVLRAGTARDVVAMELRGMSSPEREMVRRGIRAQIDEALSNVRRTISDPNVDARQATQAIKDLSSEAARDKLRLVMGEQEANRMFDAIDRAARAFDLKAGLTQNSKTATRLMMKDAVDQATDPGALGLLMQGKPLQAGRSVVQSALGTGPKAQLAKQDAIYDEVVRALTERRGTDAQRLIMELNDINRRRGQGQQLGGALGTLGAGLIGGGGYAAGQALFGQR